MNELGVCQERCVRAHFPLDALEHPSLSSKSLPGRTLKIAGLVAKKKFNWFAISKVFANLRKKMNRHCTHVTDRGDIRNE
jgi:hypothetical protein